MIWRTLPAMMLIGVAAGCSGPAPAAAPQPSAEPRQDACNAEPAQRFIGQALSPVLVEEARKIAGAKSARVLRPGQAVTMEFNPARLNVEVDRREAVTAIRCG